MSKHDDSCTECNEHIVDYRCCPKCGGETARITHVSYDDVYFLKQDIWHLGKEKVNGLYSHTYQCMNEECKWQSWPDKK